ncbi:MAG: hypothetical protein H0T73_04630 [Ardenticatenales bacterium]|nr:hypothetical protein [Ardenticatenales bacterium]
MPAQRPSIEFIIHWILRIGVAGCFIGHGVFGLITKMSWVPYFEVVGISEGLAYALMPLVGMMDISIGILALLWPTRALLLWTTFWGLWTALLRPLSGERWWELLERAGNFGVPLAMLYLSGTAPTLKAWLFQRVLPALPAARTAQAAWILRFTTAMLLIGHGAFGAIMHKAAWLMYLGTLSISGSTVGELSLISIIGWFEIVLGLLVLLRPHPGVLLFVVAWKVFTELLRPLAGEPIWEFIERAGSYTAPLALFYLEPWLRQANAAHPDVMEPETRLKAL